MIIAHLLTNMKLPTHHNEIILSKQIFQLLQNHLIVAQRRVWTLAKVAAPGPTFAREIKLCCLYVIDGSFDLGPQWSE